jgi:hypothetical protein
VAAWRATFSKGNLTTALQLYHLFRMNGTRHGVNAFCVPRKFTSIVSASHIAWHELAILLLSVLNAYILASVNVPFYPQAIKLTKSTKIYFKAHLLAFLRVISKI